MAFIRGEVEAFRVVVEVVLLEELLQLLLGGKLDPARAEEGFLGSCFRNGEIDGELAYPGGCFIKIPLPGRGQQNPWGKGDSKNPPEEGIFSFYGTAEYSFPQRFLRIPLPQRDAEICPFWERGFSENIPSLKGF